MSTDFLQGFFESSFGQFIIVVIILLLFTAILLSGKNKKFDVSALIYSSILVALSITLNQIVLFRMPQGGSVTAFSMLPIVLCALFFGVRRGLMAGLCVGLLDLIFNPYVIHPIQMLLDYPIAYGALAFSGLLFTKKTRLIPAYLLGVFSRYICAVISGIVFFSEYAPESFNPITWSLWYNITYLGVEAVITVIILLIPTFNKVIFRIMDRVK